MVIEEGLFDGFGDGFHASEMHNEVRGFVGEDFFDFGSVFEISLVESGSFAGESGDLVEDGAVAIDEVVDDGNFVAGV